ncbi:acyl-CoA N-acyltransferase [Hesseltinella vesiculosa]|uniref:Histone acetyltransferase type B catalytic subunit n=1 Tax=Hesseltinella vesiculosa TaxID=101127 RepID=A0A1X2G486_9FUNG|nr:acyl-CoA N-acyltransferase [Hesseltinella vesiculosa]
METDQPPHPAQAQVPDFDRWACNTTEVMEIGLVSPSQDDPYNVDTEYFQPEFTYPIFGMHETAFGYKDLKIKILLTSGSLRTYVSITNSGHYQPSSSSTSDNNVAIDDVPGMLKKYLSPDTTTNYDTFFSMVKEEDTSFSPIGQLVHSYSIENDEGTQEQYQIFKSSFKDPGFREYHRRMQFLVLLFIEGSSYIEDDDEKWEIYTVYKANKRSAAETQYQFVGYSTFLILPPFQGMSHGRILYQFLYEQFAKRKDVGEITVEDPNDGFCDLRDRNDYRFLEEHDAFRDLTVPVPQAQIDHIQQKFKLTNRQAQTCIELHLLSKLDKKNSQDYKAYRLQVKQRLYKFNYDALQDMDPAELKEKLNNTYIGVEDDYYRILEKV